MMRTIICLMVLMPAAAMAQEVPRFRWQRDVTLPELTETAVVAAPLDSHVYEFTREGRPDLRLRRENGEMVGFVVRAAAESKVHTNRRFFVAERVSATVNAERGLQMEFKLRDNDSLSHGLRVITPLRDFEHQVQVESSDNGKDWTTAGPPRLIFDYSRYVDARNDLVPFSADRRRRFRVTIGDVTAEQESQLLELQRRLHGNEEIDRTERTTVSRRPFRVDRIEFYHDESQVDAGKPKLTPYSPSGFSSKEDEKHRQTVIAFETRREPITEIKIIMAAENFSRKAAVEAEIEDRNGGKVWQAVASGILTRFDIGAIHREDVTLHLPQQFTSSYRVVIENRDSPPLVVTGVELAGPQYELLFLASPGQQFRLEYGSPDAPAGRYDTAALEAALSQGQRPVTAVLEPPKANPQGVPTALWKPWNDPRILVGAIIALTILLGWGLVRASRGLPQPP